MSTATSTLLTMQGVEKVFSSPTGTVKVLSDVTFSVQRGEFVAVTGPSGAGKSTLLNLAALLDRPTSGSMLFEGRCVSSMLEPELDQLRKHFIGMVFQRFCLLPQRNVLENVMFRFRYLDVEESEARMLSLRALEQVGLVGAKDRAVRLLSGGEMQRVAIARAMAWAPRLMLVDEPTGNLDREATDVVMQHFRTLNETGVTILMATHNPALLSYCRRQLSFDQGRLRDSGGD